jgi:hypothetical protein
MSSTPSSSKLNSLGLYAKPDACMRGWVSGGAPAGEAAEAYLGVEEVEVDVGLEASLAATA